MQFGNGVSGTIGLDDPTVVQPDLDLQPLDRPQRNRHHRKRLRRDQVPDIVGNIRVDQAWGLFQLSGALHQVNASYNNLTATTAAPNNLSMISGTSGLQMGRFGDGCLADQEYSDGSGRRHQDRCVLCRR